MEAKKKYNGEDFWKDIYRVVGFIIGISPFIPNLMFYWNVRDIKYPFDFSDGWFILLGFFFAWGGSSFGAISNKIGAFFMNKIKK